jgi:hypothetical protein
MKKNLPTTTMTTFSLADLPSGQRMKLEDQIMERALALWCNRRTARFSALHALRQAEREIFKSKYRGKSRRV